MAKRKDGNEGLYLEVPTNIKARLKAKAKAARRSMVAEAVVAIERHVADVPDEPEEKKGGGE